MNILMFGDIVGRPGRQTISKTLPQLKEEYKPDLIIANAENLAHGLGITKDTVEEMLKAGIDILTSGNHVWNRAEAISIIQDKKIPILRPANYPSDVPGRGWQIVRVGAKSVLVINLIGRVFFKEDFDCPFRKADEILKECEEEKLAAIIVDAHIEATSEAAALAWYLDGRVSAVLGTHTHVPTSDFKILPRGTAFISDIGMTGPADSVIGMDKDLIIKNFLTQMPVRFEVAEGVVDLNAVIVDVNDKTQKARDIKRIRKKIEL